MSVRRFCYQARSRGLHRRGRSGRRARKLRAASHFDIYVAADPPYTYRIERAEPSSTRWETRVSGEVLHLRWLVDHARPWAGVSPLQHAADTGSLSSWIKRRLAEEAERARR